VINHAAVLIVGGGVVGASVAYHLAKRGVRDVVVLDRGAGPGNGSTSRATGGFRAQFATKVNVGLSLLAREKLRAFRDEVGVDPGYTEAGYLWIASTYRSMDLLREALLVQRAAGLGEAEAIDADSVVRLNPAVPRDGIVGATWCPTDGFIRPMEILRGYLGAAERLGATIEWGVDVKEIVVGKTGRACSANTSSGSVAFDAIVNAAGPWAGELRCGGRSALPVVPLKRQVALSVPTGILPDAMPMTIFVENAFHLRVRDGRVMIIKPTPVPDGDPFDTSVDDRWIDSVRAEASMRVPCLAGLEIDRDACYAGLYEMSPDNHAILGSAPWCDNLFLANGSSGHGVMHSPALGQLLAEIICDGVASSLDVSALRPTRFSERALNPLVEML
jgi:sarcosine oxidase subunit beta